MSIETTSLIISSAALVAVILSDVVFAMQQREMRRQTAGLRAAALLNAADSMRNALGEVGRALIEFPQLRPLFYGDESSDGVSALSHSDVLRARTIAENLLDAFEISHDLSKAEEIGWRDSYREYFNYTMRCSPFVYEYLQHRAAWYPDLVALAEQARRVAD